MKRWVKTVAPVAVLLLAAGTVAILQRTEEPPADREEGASAPWVEVTRARARASDIRIVSRGRVQPADSVDLRAQVGGELDWVSPSLIPGGEIEEGERLVTIERREYRLALRRARAEVAQAQVELRTERSRAEVAEHEWESLEGPGRSEREGPRRAKGLALRRPQLEAAEARLAAARSRVQRAALDLERATIDAPFDGVVREARAEVGDVVAPGESLSTLVATDRYWVEISIPIGALTRVRVPGVDGAEEGGGDGGMPLLLGAYVQAHIDAGRIEGAVAIPPSALRGVDQVYVVREGELAIREVDVAWKREDAILIQEGVEAGERVITSPLPEPREGMSVRIRKEPERGLGA